jgi:hypothetical protein
MKTIQVWLGRLTSGVALLALVGALSGCAWSIGGEKEAGTIVQKPTQGQELIDLKRALDQGALTEEEYERRKDELLSQ